MKIKLKNSELKEPLLFGADYTIDDENGRFIEGDIIIYDSGDIIFVKDDPVFGTMELYLGNVGPEAVKQYFVGRKAIPDDEEFIVDVDSIVD
jgi:hypothetical protein